MNSLQQREILNQKTQPAEEMKTENFNIGDKAWLARYSNEPETVQCPDCFGRRFLTVILGDESRVTIECNACTRGLNYSTGRIKTWKYSARVEEITIDGMECRKGEPTRYRYNSTSSTSFIADSENLFATKEAAERRAVELRDTADQEEKKNLERRKEYPRKSWAFNATYHRKCVAHAERDLEYHKSKLDVAKLMATEEQKPSEAQP